jgi:hypothetical protein
MWVNFNHLRMSDYFLLLVTDLSSNWDWLIRLQILLSRVSSPSWLRGGSVSQTTYNLFHPVTLHIVTTYILKTSKCCNFFIQPFSLFFVKV